MASDRSDRSSSTSDPDAQGCASGAMPGVVPGVVGVRIDHLEEALAMVNRLVAQVCGSFPHHVDRGELRRAGALGLVGQRRPMKA